MELTGLIRDKEDSVMKQKHLVGLVSVYRKMQNQVEKVEQKDKNFIKIFSNPSVIAEGFFIFDL